MLGVGVGDAQSRSKNVQLMLESNMMEACSYPNDSTGLYFNTTLFPITMYIRIRIILKMLKAEVIQLMMKFPPSVWYFDYTVVFENNIRVATVIMVIYT